MARRRILRSDEEVARLLGGWKASGLSARAFGDREGIPASTLYQWSGKRGRRPRESSREDRGEFIEVELPGEVIGSDVAAFRLALGNGRELQIPPGFRAEELTRLLSVLET